MTDDNIKPVTHTHTHKLWEKNHTNTYTHNGSMPFGMLYDFNYNERKSVYFVAKYESRIYLQYWQNDCQSEGITCERL